MTGTKLKQFTEEQKAEISELRNAGYSADSMACIMHVSKQRVKKYCLEVYGRDIKYKQRFVPEHEECLVPMPRLSNPACKGHDPSLWFAIFPRDAKGPERNTAMQNSQKAIKICSSCDNQLECLDYAVKAEPFGVWGGTSEAERLYIRKILKISCAREGGIGQSIRGITRGNINKLRTDPSHVAHLFSNPIVADYVRKRSR